MQGLFSGSPSLGGDDRVYGGRDGDYLLGFGGSDLLVGGAPPSDGCGSLAHDRSDQC